MMQGHVKWFEGSRGYGFIRAKNGAEIFVHYSDIVGEGYKILEKDQPVNFEIAEDAKGRYAVNVKPIT